MPSTEPGTAQAPAPAHLPLSRGRPEGMRGPAALLLPPPAVVRSWAESPRPAPPLPARPACPAPPRLPARPAGERRGTRCRRPGRAGQGRARRASPARGGGRGWRGRWRLRPGHGGRGGGGGARSPARGSRSLHRRPEVGAAGRGAG